MRNKILALLLSAVTLFTSWSLSANTITAPADESDFLPVLRFVVASDSHIDAICDARTRRIQRVLTLAYSDAAQDPSYKTLDAAVFAGDLTDNGRKDQYLGFKAAVDSVLRPETAFLAVVAKSHDGYSMGKRSLPFYERLTGNDADFHTVIKGFHFIGLSASKTNGDHYSDYQRTWLRAQLAEAAADDPQKPIFVTHHEHVLDTVYGSTEEDGWGIDYFRDIFCEYPQIVHFSGHSHYPINDPRSIWQGAFTAVGTGALYYAELTVDGENRVHPENYGNMAQTWIVEVNAENDVRLRGFDALAAEQLCAYTVHQPADPNAREHTPALQQSRAKAPAFPANAAVGLQGALGVWNVTFPAAQSTDGTIVFLYRVRVLGSDGQEKSTKKLVNNYWQADDYETVSLRVQASAGDTICITAENAYGMQSEPLQTVIR